MRFSFVGLGLAVAVVLSGCYTTGQTTSGAEYLNKYTYKSSETSLSNTTEKKPSGEQTVDDLVRKVAAVEPTLRFPARIGIARVQNGQLTPIPAEEVQLWMEAKKDLPKEFGEFVPVSPFIANTVAATHQQKNKTFSVVDVLRLGAARQHLDAIYIYEMNLKTDESRNFLALADLTLVSDYILPSRSVQADATIQGIFMDVMQGYPYATHRADSDTVSGLTTYSRKGSAKSAVATEASLKALGNLIPDAKKTLYTLVAKQIKKDSETK